MKKIKITCTGAGMENFETLKPLQGNLKDLSELNYLKLRDQIEKEGFSFPFHVWEKEGEKFILDGHQRHRVLTKMKEEGYDIPELPVDYIEAEDINHAKRKLLADLSQYGEVANQGLYEFIESAQINVDDLVDQFRLPEIDIDKFKINYYEEIINPLKDEEIENILKGDDTKKTCPSCGYEF